MNTDLFTMKLEESCMNLHGLSLMTGISVDSLRGIMTGRCEPRLKHITGIRSALGLSEAETRAVFQL